MRRFAISEVTARGIGRVLVFIAAESPRKAAEMFARRKLGRPKAKAERLTGDLGGQGVFISTRDVAAQGTGRFHVSGGSPPVG